MGSSFSEQPDYFRLELIHNNDTDVIKNVDDIVYAIKSSLQKNKNEAGIFRKANCQHTGKGQRNSSFNQTKPVSRGSFKQRKTGT